MISFNELEVFDYTTGMDTSTSLAIINVPQNTRHPEAYSMKPDKYCIGLSGKWFDLTSGDMFLVRREQNGIDGYYQQS